MPKAVRANKDAAGEKRLLDPVQAKELFVKLIQDSNNPDVKEFSQELMYLLDRMDIPGTRYTYDKVVDKTTLLIDGIVSVDVQVSEDPDIAITIRTMVPDDTLYHLRWLAPHKHESYQVQSQEFVLKYTAMSLVAVNSKPVGDIRLSKLDPMELDEKDRELLYGERYREIRKMSPALMAEAYAAIRDLQVYAGNILRSDDEVKKS